MQFVISNLKQAVLQAERYAGELPPFSTERQTMMDDLYELRLVLLRWERRYERQQKDQTKPVLTP